MLVKLAQPPLTEVEKASLPQKQILDQKEENNKVIHVSRPAGFLKSKLQQPIRIVEQ